MAIRDIDIQRSAVKARDILMEVNFTTMRDLFLLKEVDNLLVEIILKNAEIEV